MRLPSPAKPALPLVAAALLLPGCSMIGAGSEPSPTASPAKKPAAAPKTTPPPVLTAADGTNLKACKEADCQVIIRDKADIPIGREFGIYDFRLTHTAPNRLSFTIIRTELGLVDGYVAGTGEVSLANGVTFTVEKMTPKGAVLRFEPKAAKKDSDTVNGSEGAALYGSG